MLRAHTDNEQTVFPTLQAYTLHTLGLMLFFAISEDSDSTPVNPRCRQLLVGPGLPVHSPGGDGRVLGGRNGKPAGPPVLMLGRSLEVVASCVGLEPLAFKPSAT